MLIARINGDQVLEVADYRAMFPDVSFPQSGPSNEWLAENSCMPVNLWKPYDQNTQKLSHCDPFIDGEWVYTVEVIDLTPEEIAAREESEKANIKAQAVALMSATDWVEFPSVRNADNTPHLTNADEFDAYRLALRVIAVTPTLDPAWPTKPDEAWA